MVATGGIEYVAGLEFFHSLIDNKNNKGLIGGS
jgi:hypothetical protein